MSKSKVLGLLVAVALLPAVSHATVMYMDSVDVYQIGNTSGGPVTLSWNHFYDGSADAAEMTASLTIVAEGVDNNGAGLREDDAVYINGTFLGLLTDQGFYYSFFDINPGPGALGYPQTELSTSTFFFDPSLLVVGNNLIQVVVDPTNWIVEVETSKLTVTGVPEPSTVVLLGLGLVAAFARSRRRS